MSVFMLTLFAPASSKHLCFPIKIMYKLVFSTIHATYTAHLIHLYMSTRKLLDQYKSWSSSQCNSLQSSIISSLSDPSSALHSQNALNLCSSLNVKVQRYILITITATKSNCININSDISCVFYMILHHVEGGWSKATVTTNQHLSCTLKTSRC